MGLAFTSAYSLALLFIAFLLVVLAVVSWHQRPASGAAWLTWLLVALAQWALFYALELLLPVMEAKIWAAKLQYLGIVSVAPLWLLFTLDYTRQTHRITRRVLVCLGVVPAIVLLIVFTNEWHNQFWKQIFLSTDPRATGLLVFEHGPAFWLTAAYTYFTIFCGIVALLREGLRAPGTQGKRAVTILIGVMTPWVGNAAYIGGFVPIQGLDLTPIGFVLTGAIYTFGLLRHRFFVLPPVAREALFESMNDGLLVLNSRCELVDFNPVARVLLGLNETDVGRPDAEVLARWPELAALCLRTHNSQETIERIEEGKTKFYSVRLTPLCGAEGQRAGVLLLLHDITDEHKAALQLIDAHGQLQQQFEEIQDLQTRLREQATRDELTGLYNRRYLEEALQRELAQAQRADACVSIVMLDIDHFKRVNDTFGHAAGDAMLRALGNLLMAQTRAGDIACRYGGEEMTVVMPGATLETARQRAEQWRESFEHTMVAHGDSILQATLSMGVAQFPLHGSNTSQVLHAADAALYAAKAAGRNLVVVAPLAEEKLNSSQR
jgi:diguanylate cyclase (GGDEF)-like protein/PAS domain S-box-containing protein